jgi:L-lactate dehydrogenase complex protein LldF
MHFKARAGTHLADQRLQANLKRLSQKFVTARARAVADLPEFEAIRDAAVEIRQRVLSELDVWLERFEQEATRRGASVLYAETAEQAAQLVVQIGLQHGVTHAIKTKSMVSEEVALNAALVAAGIHPLETDLGEYILQINNNEAPSHIIAPVVHKDKEQIADLFAKVHQRPRKTEISDMTREAREVMRPQFLQATMGITGANFLVAETGSVALVTNEGNEGMCTVLPSKVHVVLAGIEKIVPTLGDLATLMRLLPRSATGQTISNYVSLLTGPRAPGADEGPEHMVFVLVDAGRSALLGSEFEAMLRCIRCGACMNHCPVYQKVGGHSYGWVYPGPMGSVLTPSYVGLEQALDLPQAATLCGECHVVCPVKIPLPDLLRKLREKQFERGLRPWPETLGLRLWGWCARRPRLYRMATRVAARVLKWAAGKGGLIHRLPFLREWSDWRDMPAPSGQTFSELYQKRQRRAIDKEGNK